jgi:cell division protein FtsI/penicillin-binding protein 2
MAAVRDIFGQMRRAKASASVGLLSLALIVVVTGSSSQSNAQSSVSAFGERSTSSLYGQAAEAMLDRKFADSHIEYLLLDAPSRKILAERWPHAEVPIAPGSLLKPFVALAYAQHLQSSSLNRSQQAAASQGFPSIRCHGKSDGCWRPGGHGQLELEQALAVSCNAYFLGLAREVATHDDALLSVSARYGLPAPPTDATASMLIGVTPEWRITPLALARAYALLLGGAEAQEEVGNLWNDRDAASRLREGMRMAALAGGTVARVGVHPGGVLAKTGTASCVPDSDDVVEAGQRNQPGSHGRCRINGDGLVIVATPAENPRWVLLVRKRSTTGALAAEVAGEMLTNLEEIDGDQR